MIEIKDLQIAPTHLMLDVYIGEDVDDISEVLEKQYDYDAEDSHYRNFLEVMKERAGFCHQVHKEDGMPRLLLWVRNKDDLITLSHEIIHATWYVQYYSDFKFAYDSQEIQAYLHDYMMSQILKQM